jgi:two-component system sensor histidine kinase RpfC
MTRAYQWIRTRLSRREDSEHGQALVRLTIASLILVYLWGLGKYSGETHINSMTLVMLAEVLIAVGIITSILINPGISHARRWLGMVTDYATLAILMSLNATALSPLYILLLWVTIGNGLRYGEKYLHFAICLSFASFLVVISINPYWREQPYLAIGLLIGLAAIPAYLTSLMRNLHRITEEARRANEAKSRFLASMSHEFRSPLNGIIGMAELMRGSKLPPEQREYAEVIHTSAQTLLLLVEDVLDISAIEAGKLKRREIEFKLDDLLDRLRQMLQLQASAKGLSLEFRLDDDVPNHLFGDSAYLTQILLNLSNNAVKFTERGTVSLAVHLAGLGDDTAHIRFSVRDTGIGIPDSHKERIFHAFEQVDTGPSRRFGGTGLGTTIAHTLTKLLDGSIGLEDNPGGGSHFWIEVPMRVVQDLPKAIEESDDRKVVSFDDPFLRHKARMQSLRILVADDQHANRVVLSRILERAGHRVLVASNGEEALDALETGNVDLAVIDMHMPVISGLDVVRQLGFMQAGSKRTPILVLSADATPNAAREAEEAGAFAFLTKPIVVSRLLEAIASAAATQKSAKAIGGFSPPATNPAILEELASMGLGEYFLADFVEQCIKDAARCISNLEQTSAAHNWHDFRDAAHALKGVVENLGARLMAERCQQIMRADDLVLLRDERKLVEELRSQFTVVAEHSRREAERLSTCKADKASEHLPGPDAS